MRSLSEEDARSWLAARGIQPAPYNMPEYIFEGFYRQVGIPVEEPKRRALVEAIVTGCGNFEEALLHFTDWGIYTPAQMATITSILAGHGEKRPLIKIPAQSFVKGEIDLLSALLGLVISFEWSAYLYVKEGPTFLAWEGELLDMWVPKDQQRELDECLKPFLEPRQ